MSAHHDDRRDREDRRNEHRLRAITTQGNRGLTVAKVQHAQATKLTELNDRSVRLGGGAISLEDPRVIAAQIERLAATVRISVLAGQCDSSALADALGAQVIALRLALARVEEVRIDTGGHDGAAA